MSIKPSIIKEYAAINEMFTDSGAFKTSVAVKSLEKMVIEFAAIIAEKEDEINDLATKLGIAKQEIRILKERARNENT